MSAPRCLSIVDGPGTRRSRGLFQFDCAAGADRFLRTKASYKRCMDAAWQLIPELEEAEFGARTDCEFAEMRGVRLGSRQLLRTGKQGAIPSFAARSAAARSARSCDFSRNNQGMANVLSQAITDPVVRRLARGAIRTSGDGTTFPMAGLESLEIDQRGRPPRSAGRQSRTVRGNADVGRGRPRLFICDCPVGSDGAFCGALGVAGRVRLADPRREIRETGVAAQDQGGHLGRRRQ